MYREIFYEIAKDGTCLADVRRPEVLVPGMHSEYTSPLPIYSFTPQSQHFSSIRI